MVPLGDNSPAPKEYVASLTSSLLSFFRILTPYMQKHPNYN